MRFKPLVLCSRRVLGDQWFYIGEPLPDQAEQIDRAPSHTRPDISFSLNLLARYSSSPTRMHWTGIQSILRYLRGTMDIGIYYTKESKLIWVGYVDAGYPSDAHTARSQTGYVFTCGGGFYSHSSAHCQSNGSFSFFLVLAVNY